MAKTMTLEDALAYGIKFAEKSGADQSEALSVTSKDLSIDVEKNLPKIVAGIAEGLSFRIVKNNNQGFAFTKTLTAERIENTITTAMQNAKAKGNDPDFKTLPHPIKSKVKPIPFDKNLEDITTDFLADKFTYIIDTINDVKHLHYLQGSIFTSIVEEHLINSNGVDIKGKGGGIGGYAAAITTKGLIPNYSFGIKGGPSLENFTFESMAQEAIDQTLRAAAPKTMNFEKEVPIILEPEASLGMLGGLFNLLSNQLQGNNIDSGSTPYSDQIGNLVATEDFSFVDNGINVDKLGTSRYDGEGVPRETTTLIDKGVLKTYLLDTYYGTKLGLESNGKSSRSGVMGFGSDPVKTPPRISASSLEILPGSSSKDEIIAETKEGFMIRSLMGLHMSDRSSGRFAVTGFGWYIKNGEVKYPVQGINISGMLPDLIKNIDMISSERQSMLLTEAPYIRFANVSTAGKKFDFKTRFGLSIVKVLTTLKVMKHPLF
ncbi:MAG: TldD/PmbA family protein [Candidatus Heimdallarchaeota archaeon]